VKPWRALSLVLLLLAGCGAARAAPVSPATPTSSAAEIELVETTPAETTLDHADVRDASDVWPEMIDRARHTIDLGELYASDAGGDLARTSKLAPVLAALERAIGRGVRVRLIVDASFAPKYPETVERLRRAGVDVRTIDCATRYGGVQHAKYMIVDGAESFVGSQNFDWRALAHIHEVGVRVRSSAVAGALADVFETDWALADASTPGHARARAHAPTASVKARTGESVTLWASPRGWLPDESRWDLDGLVGLLDGARTSLDLQVLTYSTTNRDGSAFPTLDAAVRRAAARGVRVRMLVSHWGAKPGSHARASVAALGAAPNVEVKVLTIPPFSGGDIPYARVAHAKYLVVDGRAAWVGTSNWEGDYFLRTRNVAVVAEGGALPARLDRVFEDGWRSAYAAPLGP
jgi:phosphatidylserine/phosphatidylglycerophosphate/cardiolipin synthase-like enzyme